jgi:hypothetical protein
MTQSTNISRWPFVLGILAAVLMSGCKPPSGGVPVSQTEIEPTFMYANDEGQIRLVEVVPSGGDTTYNIATFTNLNNSGRNGVINTSRSWYYDMSPADSAQEPRFSAYLSRENPAWREVYGPTSKYFSKLAYISDTKRVNDLEFYSQLDDQLKTLEYETTTYYGVSKSSHFVDRNTLLTFWTDASQEYKSPSQIRYSAVLLRYALNATDPTTAEAIATFEIVGNPNGLNSPYRITEARKARVTSSANGEFYIVWSPTRVFGYVKTIYYIRKDGSAALNSMNEIGKDYRNDPGFLIHAMDPHPKKDSILVVADISDDYASGPQNNAIHIMHLPDSPKNWLRPMKTLSWARVTGDAMLNWALTYEKDNLFLKYSPEGDKIAIAHALPGRQAEVVIWEPQTDITKTFTFPSGSNIDKISKPAWHPTDNRFLYITGANTASADTSAHIFMLDTDKSQGTLKQIDWNSPAINRLDIPDDETLRQVKPLISRRFN